MLTINAFTTAVIYMARLIRYKTASQSRTLARREMVKKKLIDTCLHLPGLL